MSNSLRWPEAESRIHLITTSVLHIIIGATFIFFPNSMSIEHMSALLAFKAVHIIWGVLFSLSALIGFAICFSGKTSLRWIAFTIFASICGMWAAMGAVVFLQSHVGATLVVVYAYLAYLHVRRARQRSFDYEKAQILITEMEKLRNISRISGFN